MSRLLLMVPLVGMLAVAGCERIERTPEVRPEYKGLVLIDPEGDVDTQVEELIRVNVDQLSIHLNSVEKLLLSGGAEDTTVAKDTVEEALSDMALTTTPSPANADLLIEIKASSKLNEKFGEFYSFDASQTVRVLDAVTRDVIDSKKFSARGERKLDELDAAESALEKASREAADHLVDALTKKSPYLLSTELVIEGMPNEQMAQTLRTILAIEPWINKVDLTIYDAFRQVAVYSIRYAAIDRGNISHKLYGIKGFEIAVVSFDRKGIHAVRIEE